MAEIEVPPYFLCPITLDIMKDPVTVSTGITYDRESIEKWIFSEKNATCPVTKQLLSDPDYLTPNITLRRLIQSWCTLHAATHGVERLPTPKSPVTRSQLLKLINDASSPLTQIKSLQTLRSIATQNQSNRRSMETAGVAEFLSSLIVRKTAAASRAEVSEDLSDLTKACDEALAILYSLRLSEPALKKTLSNVEFVESLTFVMQNGSYESRAYSVMLLKSIVEVSEPALLIGLKPEFFSELSQILSDQISQKASKATLKVMIGTCAWGRNRIKAAEAGTVHVLIDLLLDSPEKRTCEMVLTVMDYLCECAEGRAELMRHEGGLAIVSKKVLRVSQAASERGVRILHSISRFSATRGVVKEMLEIGVVAKLCLVVQVDCGSKTKERAREILKMHSRAWRSSSCLPANLTTSFPS